MAILPGRAPGVFAPTAPQAYVNRDAAMMDSGAAASLQQQQQALQQQAARQDIYAGMQEPQAISAEQQDLTALQSASNTAEQRAAAMALAAKEQLLAQMPNDATRYLRQRYAEVPEGVDPPAALMQAVGLGNIA